jgi:hypothetical protein
VTPIFRNSFLIYSLKAELIRRLGAYRCYEVDLDGFNDPNELLNDKGIVGLYNAFDKAARVPIKDITEASELMSSIMKMKRDGGLKPGARVGGEAFQELYSYEPARLTVVTGVPTHGKALDINTNIPTPNGFVKMRDIKIGDKVFGSDGKVCTVTNATEIMHGRPCYKMTFSGGQEIIADEEHQWCTHDEKARRSRRNKQKRIRENGYKLQPRGIDQSFKMNMPSVRTTLDIFNTIKCVKGSNHSIDNCNVVYYEEKELPMSPYLLGAWLGDGSSYNGSIHVDVNDISIIDKIKRLGYSVTKRKHGIEYGIKSIKPILRELNLLENKHIPKDFLFSSYSQRMELLKGLMDTDGFVHKKQIRCEFTTTTESLAKDVHSLICSLGISASILKYPSFLYGKRKKDKYRIHFSTDKEVFSLKRKRDIIRKSNHKFKSLDYRYITNCEKVDSVPVRCIEVDSDNHLFLASESYIPTHNSVFLDDQMVRLAIDHDWVFAVFSPESFPIELHVTRLMSKINGKYFNKMSEGEILNTLEFINSHFIWIYPEDDNYKLRNVLNITTDVIKRYGANALIIDPWTEIDKDGSNTTDDINEHLTMLNQFKRAMNIHIFLVAHPTKMQKDPATGKVEVPDLYSISGSANFYNKADGGITVYRDFENGTVQIYVNKIKFDHLGKIGNCTMKYNLSNGRYEDFKTVGEVGSDDSDWLVKEPIQLSHS